VPGYRPTAPGRSLQEREAPLAHKWVAGRRTEVFPEVEHNVLEEVEDNWEGMSEEDGWKGAWKEGVVWVGGSEWKADESGGVAGSGAPKDLG